MIASHYSHLLEERERDDVLFTLAVQRLALGQFELAHAALAQLASRDAPRVQRLLLDLLENGAPSDWLASPGTPSDAHLRWLALAALARLGAAPLVPARVRRRVECDLLLHAAFARAAPASVVLELASHFRDVFDNNNNHNHNHNTDSASPSLAGALVADYVAGDALSTTLSSTTQLHMRQLLVDSPVLARSLASFVAADAVWHASALAVAHEALATASVPVLVCALQFLASAAPALAADVDSLLRDSVLLCAEGPLARSGDAALPVQLDRWLDAPDSAPRLPRRAGWRHASDSWQARVAVQQALLTGESRELATRYAALQALYARSMHEQHLRHGVAAPLHFPLHVLLALEHAPARAALLRQFWIDLHSTASANETHALELLLAECIKLVRARRLADASRLLDAVPPLRPLAVLLAWDAADENAQRQRDVVEALCPLGWSHEQRDAAPLHAAAAKHAVELARRTRVAFWAAHAVLQQLSSRAAPGTTSFAVRLGADHTVTVRDADTLFVHLMTMAHDASLVALLRDYWPSFDRVAALAVVDDGSPDAKRDAALLRALFAVRLVHDAINAPLDELALDAAFAEATQLLCAIESTRMRSEPLLALERMLFATAGAGSAAAAAAPAKTPHSWLAHFVARPLEADVNNRPAAARPVADRIVRLLAACVADAADSDGGSEWRALQARAADMLWRLSIVERCARITAPHVSAPRALFGDHRPSHNEFDDASDNAASNLPALLLATPATLVSATLRAGALDLAQTVIDRYGADAAQFASLLRQSSQCAALRAFAAQADVNASAFVARVQQCIDTVSVGIDDHGLLATEVCIDAALCAANGDLSRAALAAAKAPLARAAAATPGSPHVAALARLLNRLNEALARATTGDALAPLLLDLRAFERRASTVPAAAAAAAPMRSAPALAAARAADEALARLQAALLGAAADAPDVEQAAVLVGTARAFEALSECEADDADAADIALLTAYLSRVVRHVLHLGDELAPADGGVSQRRYFALMMRAPAELLERVVFADKAHERAAAVASAVGVDLTRVTLDRLSINRRVKRRQIAAAFDAAVDADDADADVAPPADAETPAVEAAVVPPAVTPLAGVSERDLAELERERVASLAFVLNDELASQVARRSPLLASLACLLRAPLSQVDHALAMRALRGVMARDEFAAFRRWVARRTLAYDAFVRVFGDAGGGDALLEAADAADEVRLMSRLQTLADAAVRASAAVADESSAAAHAFALLQGHGAASDVDDFYVAAAEQLVLDGDAPRALRLLEQRLVAAAVPDFVLLVRLKRLSDAELGESWRLVRRVRDTRRVVPYALRHFEHWPLVPALQTMALLRDRVDDERGAQLEDLLKTLQLVEALVRAAARANVVRFNVLSAARPTPTETDWYSLFVKSRAEPAALVKLALRCDAFALARELHEKLFVAAPELLLAIERGHVRQLLDGSREADALDVLLALPRDTALGVASALLGDQAWLTDANGDIVLQLQVELFLTRFLVAAGSPGAAHLFAAMADDAADFEFSDDDASVDDNDDDDSGGGVPVAAAAAPEVPAPAVVDAAALSSEQLATLRRRAHGLAALLCVPPSLATEHRALASRPLLLIECLLMLARTDAVAAILAGVPELKSADTDALAVGYMRRALRYDADSAATRARARHVALTVAARRPTRAVGGVRTLLIDDYDADVAHCLRGVLRAAEWRLTGDAAADDGTRSRHFFAAAPSLSLARRLLALVSDKAEAGRACVDAAEYLSAQLLRLPSAAVDAGEGADIVALMQRVLRHGKSLFVAASVRRDAADDGRASAEGVALCDSLLSHTELLGQLHAAGCVPMEMSLKDFRNEARTRALRDALIGSDDVVLALEVATKCRLSSEPVFIAWGLALLELGEYAAARDKFARCMTRPADRPASFVALDSVADERSAASGSSLHASPHASLSPAPSPAPSGGVVRGTSRGSTVASTAQETLNKIINVLDLRSAAPTIAALRQQQRELRDYLAEKGAANHFDQMSVDAFLGAMHLPDASSNSAAPTDAGSVAQARLNECVYYVTQYGSCPRALEFLAARSLHRELVSFVLRAAVPPALFVEHAVLPALARVQLQSLLEAMRDVDVTLGSFSDYLLAVCKYFNHRRAWQLLLDVQVFMGDAARAALTCVKVFLAATTEDERLQWLERAKQQLERALAPESIAAAAVAAANAAAAAAAMASSSPSSSSSPNSGSPPSSPRGTNSTIAGAAPILTDAELSRYLRSVQLQIDVVRFLHAPANRKLVSDEQRALSLFGSGRQKAALCEQLLVLGNFDLAFAIMQDFRLPVVRVYVNAIDRLARSNLAGRVNDLLKDIRLMGIDERQFGEVVMAAIEIYAGELQRPDMAEKFIDKLSDARHVVRAHALVGNFKQAYIGAARLESVDDVHMVRNMASDAGAGAIVAMCDKFLVQAAKPNSAQP